MLIQRAKCLWSISLLGVCLALCVSVRAEEFAVRLPAAAVAINDVKSYRDAVDAVVWTMVKQFDLPVPRATVEVHSSRESFEQGLVKHLQLAPDLAHSTAEFARAGVGNNVVLVNEQAMKDFTWPRRVEEMAHELTHALQITLANRPGIARPQWLIEGSAEWLGFNIMAALGAENIGAVRTRLIRAVGALGHKQELPNLLELNTLPEWIQARKKYSFDATYSLSFLAIDFLVARHDLPAVFNFFRQFQSSSNYRKNFRIAFGEDVPEFRTALEQHLASVLDDSGKAQ